MKKLFVLFICAFVHTPAFAIKIVAVKDSRILLDGENHLLNEGERYLGKDSAGKARVLIEILQVKNQRALATVIKGKASSELTFTPYTGKSPQGTAASGPTPKKIPLRDRRNSSGAFLLGYTQNSMTVKSSTNSVNLSGSSFDLSAMYQLKVDGGFGARLLVGYDTLVAKGDATSAICSGSTACEVSLGYLGLEAIGKYNWGSEKEHQYWVGAGLGFLFALNKSSNILDTSKISTNQTLIAAAGMDWRLNRDSFIPIQIDYDHFPDNSASSAHKIVLRLGYGLRF